MPPLSALLKQQRYVIAQEGSVAHPWFLKTNLIYILSGTDAGFFEEPAYESSLRFCYVFQYTGPVYGVVITALSIAIANTNAVPIDMTWGGLFPFGVVILLTWRRCLASGHLYVLSHIFARSFAISGEKPKWLAATKWL